jgi:site-specific DNA recombinase
MAAQAATEGRFLGGRPPYGYQLVDAGAHPNPGKANMGARLHKLAPDPTTAPIVAGIFEEYASGKGLYAIAERLTRDGVPSPSAYDRARNPHRTSHAWSKSAVRAILTNPRYTGMSVWGRQRRDEVLVDVDDVAAGHRSLMRWNDEDRWIRSPRAAHEPLITTELFESAQARRAANARRGAERKGRRTRRPYLLRGLLRCGVCHRRMQGTWNHGRPHYRCRYPAEYALTEEIDHPKAVYLREEEIEPPLDHWIARVFEPEHLEETCEQLAAAQAPSVEDEARLGAVREALVECDARLGRYREALEAGADPTVVAAWIKDVQEERRRLEHQLRGGGPTAVWSPGDIRGLVESLRDLVRVLRAARHEKKSDLYESLGLNLTYEPTERRVRVEADLSSVRMVRVGGGI